MPPIVQNRKARHDYHVIETFEAGIALVGTEVKSCRARDVALVDSHVRVRKGELWLVGAHIAEYKAGNRNNHEPRRDRKLLLHKREIARLAQAVEAKGLTLVPLSFYFTRQKVKVQLALCRGKRDHDKRDAMKERMHEREARRAIERHR